MNFSELVKERYSANRLFGLPENIVPVAMLPIGYLADDAEPADRHYSRAALADILLR